ncbi:unnamed protein product [Closterium sp. NIES-64]|nr:unnamed protein product [Closterium sp. NIES-64]
MRPVASPLAARRAALTAALRSPNGRVAPPFHKRPVAALLLRPAALNCGPAALNCGPAALNCCGPAALCCGPTALTCGPAAFTCGPAALKYCGPAALNCCGTAALLCGPAALCCGPAALTSGPAAFTCGPAPLVGGPAALTCGLSTVVMATPCVLAFDAGGRAIDFDVWVDDLQLFLQCDRADGLSLFDLTSGASPAPAADADATVRSQWATRDAAARLAVRRHLPTSESAHFNQYKSAQSLYDDVVARYSSPATAALSRLMLPYLFPDLAAFPTVADLITHLRTSDTRYRAALPADFCAKNPPPMYITLYYIVTRLPDSLRVVRDHFLSVCPTTLTVDLLEKSLLAAEKSIVAVGASRGDPRTPIFEGAPPPPFCPLLPLLLRPTSLVLSRSVRRLPLVGDAALARAKGARALEERAGAVEVEAAGGVGVAVGVEVGEEVSVAAVEAEVAAAVVVGAEVAEVVAVEAAAEAAVVAEAAEAAEAAGVAVEL